MLNKEIPYGSAKHREVLEAVTARYQFSKNEMGKKYEQWSDNEESFMAYIPETEANRLRRQKREEGKPQYTTLQVPYSYAVAMTAHTYWTSVFLARTPVFQFAARHGEPQSRTEAVTALMDYQLMVGQMLPALYVWLLDPTKYGFGVVGSYWMEEKSTVSRIEEVPDKYLGVFDTGKRVKKRIVEEVRGYTGNKLYNIRPYDFFPDPRVPVGKFQEGEFAGRYVEVGWNTILKRKAQGLYFNIEQLEKRRLSALSEREQGSPQIDLPNSRGDASLSSGIIKDVGFVQLLEMYIEIVPSEWGLGATDYPEKWAFTVADNAVVISAMPMGMYHNKFPFSVIEYEPDGYSLISRSMMEVMEPLQNALTWLLNSHLQNVRKAINDMFVFDPSRIVQKDITDPQEGRYIRLKPDYYGTDVKQAIHQFQVGDVTRGHVGDMQVITDLLQRVTGVTDNVMGMVNPGGRKTATEVRNATSFGTNRLKTNAEYMSAVGWGPLVQMMVQTSQQMYDDSQQFRIVGDIAMGKPAFANVTPDMIQGFFDFVPVDGTLPVDKFALANVWKELLMQMAGSDALMQMYDVGKVFAYTARLAGAKDVDQFKLQVVPDDQLQDRARAGDVVPLDQRDVTQPAQLPGMGNLA